MWIQKTIHIAQFGLIVSGAVSCKGGDERNTGFFDGSDGPPKPAEGLGSDESETSDEPPVPVDLGSAEGAEEESGGRNSENDDPFGALPAIPKECENARGQSNVGCLFYGVDLDQADELDYEIKPYAIAISNVQTTQEARVTVERKQNGVWQKAGPEIVVGPLDLSFSMLPDMHQEDSGVFTGGAFRVRTDVPVIAYQFSPVDGAESFTSDASLLLPFSSWDSIYQNAGHPVTVPDGANGHTWSSYVTIVAGVDGTEVKVVPSVNTNASLPSHNKGPAVPAGTAGVPMFISLDEGDIANVSVSQLESDLTGTVISSDEEHPIAVFSGTECSFIPADKYACDHVEEQLVGVQQWGTRFIAARIPARAIGATPPEDSLWQITASEDNTKVELIVDPGVTGISSGVVMLSKGETIRYYVGGNQERPGDFEIVSDKPISVLNYMLGEEAVEDGGVPGPGGDPAMVQMSPVDQFLDRYVILVPLSWENDYAVVTRPKGAVIQMDGETLSDSLFKSVGSGDFEVARILVADGVHSFESSLNDADRGEKQGFSVVVVGYDSYDSYAYLGGAGTSIINPVEID